MELLHRVLELEVMDTKEEAYEYDRIDNRVINESFVEFLASKLGFTGGKLIDLGTGPSDIPIAIASRFPNAQITALEMGAHMLAIASKKIAAAGLRDRIDLRRADAKQTGLPDKSFDFVICNSLIHHIEEPKLIFREIVRLAGDSGGLFLKDLRRPKSMTELENLVSQYALAGTPNQKLLFKNSLHAALTQDEVKTYAQDAGLKNFTLSAPGDRHWQLIRKAKSSPIRQKRHG